MALASAITALADALADAAFALAFASTTRGAVGHLHDAASGGAPGF